MIVLKIIGTLLKIIGVLLLVVLAVLLAAMCIPVHITVKYEPAVTFGIRYWFIRYYFAGGEPTEKSRPPGPFRRLLLRVWEWLKLLFGLLALLIARVAGAVGALIDRMKILWRRLFRVKPKKRKRVPKEEKEPEPQQSFFGALREQRGFFGALAFFVDLGKALGGAMVRIYRGVAVHRFVLRVSITGEDAADTAIQYGELCAAAYPALSFLLGHTRGYEPKRQDIEISPDFGGEGIRLYFDGELTVYPILVLGNLLWAVIKFGFAQLQLTWNNRKNAS